MTSAEPQTSKPDTASPPPTHAERQASRLAGAVQAKKAEIDEVLRRHGDSIALHTAKVEKAEGQLKKLDTLALDAETFLRATESVIELRVLELHRLRKELSVVCDEVAGFTERYRGLADAVFGSTSEQNASAAIGEASLQLGFLRHEYFNSRSRLANGAEIFRKKLEEVIGLCVVDLERLKGDGMLAKNEIATLAMRRPVVADVLADVTRERDLALDEPTRHLAALRKDLEKLERRLALSQARHHHTALASGSTVPSVIVGATEEPSNASKSEEA